MFDHFGILAPFYEKVIKPKSPSELIKFSDLPVDGPILDLGGGTGRISQYLISMGEPVINADVSLKMLVQSKLKNGLSPICTESEQLPFPDKYFSRIIMVDALHHVKDQSLTIKEMCRVIRRDGLILIEEPDISKSSIKVLAIMEKIMLMRSHFLSPTEIASIFAANGLTTSITRDSYISWVIAKPVNNQ